MSGSTAITQRSQSEDYLPFLDYPHAHDPTKIFDVAALSTDMLKQLPQDVQDSLWELQESTSVIYGSYIRLLDLQNQKFDRLSFSEGSNTCTSRIPKVTHV